MRSALRGVLKEAWRLGYVDAERFRRATDLKLVRGGSDVAAGRELSAGELRALLDYGARLARALVTGYPFKP